MCNGMNRPGTAARSSPPAGDAAGPWMTRRAGYRRAQPMKGPGGTTAGQPSHERGRLARR